MKLGRYTTRTECACCGGSPLQQVLDLGHSPLANAYPVTVLNGETYYPLRVGVCELCWLVQLLDVPASEEVFGGDYAFYSSTSPTLVRYHRDQAEGLWNVWNEQARKLTVEIGCNDGDLLEHLHRRGVPTLGVDPATGPAAAARERGLDVITEPFDIALARRIRAERGPAGLIIANNVAAHVEDPNDLLTAVAQLLDGAGVAVIEVQYVGDLLLGNQIDQVYHEHRFFYSVSSLRTLASHAGLNVIDVEETTPQGGSVRVTLAKMDPGAMRVGPDETWLRDVTTYATLQSRANRIREKLVNLLDVEHDEGRTVAGWSAPAKAVTLLNFCNVDVARMSYVEDSSPSKQGRCVPGTGIPVVAHGDRPDPDTFVLLGWNYAGSFLRQRRGLGDVRVITPIPNPVLL